MCWWGWTTCLNRNPGDAVHKEKVLKNCKHKQGDSCPISTPYRPGVGGHASEWLNIEIPSCLPCHNKLETTLYRTEPQHIKLARWTGENEVADDRLKRRETEHEGITGPKLAEYAKKQQEREEKISARNERERKALEHLQAQEEKKKAKKAGKTEKELQMEEIALWYDREYHKAKTPQEKDGVCKRRRQMVENAKAGRVLTDAEQLEKENEYQAKRNSSTNAQGRSKEKRNVQQRNRRAANKKDKDPGSMLDAPAGMGGHSVSQASAPPLSYSNTQTSRPPAAHNKNPSSKVDPFFDTLSISSSESGSNGSQHGPAKKKKKKKKRTTH